MNKSKELQTLASYILHVPFVAAQTYFGVFLILLVWPIIRFVMTAQSADDVRFSELLLSFPEFWKQVFDLTFLQLVFGLGLCFPIGMVSAEFFYRTGIALHLHRDLSIEDSVDDPKQKEIERFIYKCRMQERPAVARVFEWEFFQFTVCYYAEWLARLFLVGMGLAIGCVFWKGDGVPKDDWSWLIAAIVVWGVGLVFAGVMWRARNSKHESFKRAYIAIKAVLEEEQA